MLDLLSRAALIANSGRVKPVQLMSRVPTVSVVVPCYNYGRFLRRCIHSVTQEQPGIDLEILLVDDRSTDDSLCIARSIAAEDPRVKLIQHSCNRGHIATYNHGIEAATGEFVLLLSADDLATPGALTRAAALLTAEISVGLVYGNAIHFSEELPPSRGNGRAWVIWPGIEWLRARCRSGYNVVASPEVMMRTSVLRAIGGYRSDLPHAGDFEMWLRASVVSDVGFLYGVDQAYYRHHNVNMNKKLFRSGSVDGQLIDLKQRWQAFEVVFSSVGRQLEERERLLETARRTIAHQALQSACYAYARGFRNFPVCQFEKFAYEVCPDVKRTKAARALARRKMMGMTSLPLHPLWAPSALVWRSTELVRRWRRRKLGV